MAVSDCNDNFIHLNRAELVVAMLILMPLTKNIREKKAVSDINNSFVIIIYCNSISVVMKYLSCVPISVGTIAEMINKDLMKILATNTFLYLL